MARSSPTRSSQLVTFRYLTRFTCVGGECSDSCCDAGWRIDVNEGHYRKLRRALGEARFAASVVRNADGQRSPQRFALLVLREGGICHFLDEEKLCSLQRRHGEELLPNTCALYPRVLSRVGARLEQTAFLSCPETARLALLEDDAMELEAIDAPRGIDDRYDGRELIPRDPVHPYARYFDEVRGAAQALLSSTQYPVASRVLFVAAFGRNVSPFFRRDLEAASFDEERFAEEMSAIAGAELPAALDRELRSSRRGTELAAGLVLQILASRLEAACPPVFRKLASTALRELDGASGRAVLIVEESDPTQARTIHVEAATLASVHARREGELDEEARARMERWFENYARSYWFREWYVHSPDLLHHARGLAVRIAVLRFVLLGQPALSGSSSHSDPAARRRFLDDAAVEVFYSFARAIEHQSGFVDRVMESLDEEGWSTLGHVMALLRF